MQYRRLHFALLLVLSWAFSLAGIAQTATYHLHKEASAITAADDKLLTGGPDGTSVSLTTTLDQQGGGRISDQGIETQTGDPNTAGVIPSGSTLTFNVFMRKTANTGTVFPRAKIRLNNATGTLFCTATGATALSTTVKLQAISCTTTANIAMAATDRFYLWVGVNLTATSATAFSGELDIEGTLNGNFDSNVVLPLGTAAPTISSLTPGAGAVATSVVIAGTNFRSTQASSTVSFNGIASTPTAWSATSITAPVPDGRQDWPGGGDSGRAGKQWIDIYGNPRAEHYQPCSKYGRGWFGSNNQRIELWFDPGQRWGEVRHTGRNNQQLEFDEHCCNGSVRRCNGKRGRDRGRGRGQQRSYVHGDFSASDYQRNSRGWWRIWIVVHDYGNQFWGDAEQWQSNAQFCSGNDQQLEHYEHCGAGAERCDDRNCRGHGCGRGFEQWRDFQSAQSRWHSD